MTISAADLIDKMRQFSAGAAEAPAFITSYKPAWAEWREHQDGSQPVALAIDRARAAIERYDPTATDPNDWRWNDHRLKMGINEILSCIPEEAGIKP